jgi:hypothetical protein
MWKLDLKCIHKYIYDLIQREREREIVIEGLTEGTTGAGRGKENDSEE